MTGLRDDAVCLETVAVLDAVELGVKELVHILLQVARGAPLEPQRAEHLVAQCRELLEQIIDTRNVIRLSGGSNVVH